MEKKTFKIHPYDRKLVFLYGKSMKKMLRHLEKELEVDLDNNKETDGTTFYYMGSIYVIIKNTGDALYDDGVLVHEIAHASLRCLQQVDISTSFKNDNHEPFTYLLENLFKRCKKFKDKD